MKLKSGNSRSTAVAMLVAFAVGSTVMSTALAESANATGAAHAPTPAKQLPAPADAASVAAHGRAFDDAKSFAKKGDLVAAEDRLSKDSDLAPNSSAWHAETSARLAALAGALARENNGALVGDLAARALQHLTQAHGLEQNAHAKSRIKADMGWIQENLVSDIPAAIANYQSAIDADPANKAAQEALARLQMTEANLRAKIQTARE